MLLVLTKGTPLQSRKRKPSCKHFILLRPTVGVAQVPKVAVTYSWGGKVAPGWGLGANRNHPNHPSTHVLLAFLANLVSGINGNDGRRQGDMAAPTTNNGPSALDPPANLASRPLVSLLSWSCAHPGETHQAVLYSRVASAKELRRLGWPHETKMYIHDVPLSFPYLVIHTWELWWMSQLETNCQYHLSNLRQNRLATEHSADCLALAMAWDTL